MRIICEKIESRQWCAWVEEDGGTTFSGETAAQAAERLIASLPGVTVDQVVPDNARSRVGRYVFVVGRICPDCDGSGIYTGLMETGDCRTCRGTGRTIDDAPIPF